MQTRILLLLVGVVLSLPRVCSEEPPKRPDWNQKKAVEIVKNVIALEEKGDLPWDRIPWQTDQDKAAALAQKEQKPLFVFFFLKKNVGPDTAPC